MAPKFSLATSAPCLKLSPALLIFFVKPSTVFINSSGDCEVNLSAFPNNCFAFSFPNSEAKKVVPVVAPAAPNTRPLAINAFFFKLIDFFFSSIFSLFPSFSKTLSSSFSVSFSASYCSFSFSN